MGSKSANQCPRYSSADYYINDDGSVTKKDSAESRAMTSSFVVKNEEVITPKFTTVNSSIKHNTEGNKTIINTKTNIRSKIFLIGISIHVIATLVFLILMIVNTTDTFGGHVEACLGLSLFSVFMYYIITRPILNWINRLLPVDIQ